MANPHGLYSTRSRPPGAAIHRAVAAEGIRLEGVSNAHYFTTPEGPSTRRQITVEINDQPLQVTTAGGIFSPAGIDKGTQILLRHVPAPASHGALLDIGCGWGPITLTMAAQSPQAEVWGVDVNELARELCAENAAALSAALGTAAQGAENVKVAAPEDVPDHLQFQTIWSNPPIRIGKPALHELLSRWLPRLAPGGEAFLVVQKNLGADSLQRWISDMLNGHAAGSFSVQRATTDKGFRILHVTRSELASVTA